MLESILKSFTKFFVFFTLIAVFYSSVSEAQNVEIIESVSSFSVGDSVTFSVAGSGIDFDRADISWTMSGRNIKNGFGEKSVNVIIPKEESVLDLLVVTAKGEKYSSSFRLYTKSVLLYWEATDSYVPAWYGGKKMLAKGGTVRVHALTNISGGGQKIKDSDIMFNWKIDGILSKKHSGYGKNYIDLEAPETSGESLQISVIAKPKLSDDEIEAVETIPLTKTEVLLYLKANNTKKVLSGVNKLPADDFIVSAEPYFFSLDKKYDFFWTIGGGVTKGFNEKGFRSGKKNSFANIKVKVEHVKKIFQEAESEFTATF
jgi:hypothetical protein